MISFLSGWIFRKIFGWKVEGHYPNHIDKKIVVVAPHTSNWDFPIGILFRAWYRLDIRFVGKKSLFKFPFGGFMQWMGGLPVDRKKSVNFTKGVVQLFKDHNKLDICITPEGTRRRVSKFKSGFYHIAKDAGVHILPIKFDWKSKTMIIENAYTLTGDKSTEMAKIEHIFRGVIGKNPNNSFL